jgi:hypothetical protein
MRGHILCPLWLGCTTYKYLPKLSTRNVFSYKFEEGFLHESFLLCYCWPTHSLMSNYTKNNNFIKRKLLYLTDFQTSAQFVTQHKATPIYLDTVRAQALLTTTMNLSKLKFNHSSYINSQSYQVGLYLQTSISSKQSFQYYKHLLYYKQTTDALGTAVERL